jgi:hypothetical protein
VIPFSERQGVALSAILFAIERRLQKKYSSIEGVVALWIRLKADSTEKIKPEKVESSLRPGLRATW